MLSTVRAEFVRYKVLAERAAAQLNDAELNAPRAHGHNSVAVIIWHLSGNLTSRFTDFLTSDGEKPWRLRDTEFESRTVSSGELMTRWENAWRVLLGALSELTDSHLDETVTIRSQELSVRAALHRSLAHVAYHVGQIVYIARATRGADWQFLSIPPGQTETYNQNPTRETAGAHAAALAGDAGARKNEETGSGVSGVRSAHLRVARPTDHMAENLTFYRDGLGFEVIGSFEDHDGFDGMMLGHPGAPYHLEFTSHRGGPAGRAPTQDNLLVFYLPDRKEWEAAVNRMKARGYEPAPSYNPYWDRHGVTFEDPDGYRVVLQQTAWG